MGTTGGSRPTPRSRPQHEHAAEHAALASPTRLRLLEALRGTPRGGHPDDLADHLELHPSTVRGHLTLLIEAGFVEPVIEAREGPGRPRVLFVPTTKELPDALRYVHYRGLAKALSGYLMWREGSPSDAASSAGRRWAADLVREEPPGERAVHPLARAGQLLATAGFPIEVALDAGQVLLVQRSCPFADVVADHAEVVCALHLGLVDGIVDHVTGRWDVSALASSRDDQTCMARLRPRARSGFSEPAAARCAGGRDGWVRPSGAGDGTTARG
jgi:predicted ArsR family transcriptional regulator